MVMKPKRCQSTSVKVFYASFLMKTYIARLAWKSMALVRKRVAVTHAFAGYTCRNIYKLQHKPVASRLSTLLCNTFFEATAVLYLMYLHNMYIHSSCR